MDSGGQSERFRVGTDGERTRYPADVYGGSIVDGVYVSKWAFVKLSGTAVMI